MVGYFQGGFMIFANWTQFIDIFPLKFCTLGPHKHEDQSIHKGYIVKCDITLHCGIFPL